jgi:hypothetical protein
MQTYRNNTTFKLPVSNKSANSSVTTTLVPPTQAQAPIQAQAVDTTTKNEIPLSNATAQQTTQRIFANQRPVTLPNGRILPPFTLYHAPNTTNNKIASRTTQTQTVVHTTAPQPNQNPTPTPAPQPNQNPTPTLAPQPNQNPTPTLAPQPTPALISNSSQ